MQNSIKLKLKTIFILVFIFSFFLITFINIFIRDIPVLSSLLKDYITSGNSIFIPTLPYYNILGFLPEKYQLIHLTIGHLIDIFIVYNLIGYIDSFLYHYVKNTCLNGEPQRFISIDSYPLVFKGKFYALSQDPVIVIELKGESRYYLEDKFLDVNLERNCQLKERTESFHDNLNRKNIIQYKLLHKKFEFRFNNCCKNPIVFYFHPISEKFWTYVSKNHYHPKFCNFTDFNKHFQWEGG